MLKVKYKTNFPDIWLENEEFKPWLQKRENNSYIARFKACVKGENIAKKSPCKQSSIDSCTNRTLINNAEIIWALNITYRNTPLNRARIKMSYLLPCSLVMK